MTQKCLLSVFFLFLSVCRPGYAEDSGFDDSETDSTSGSGFPWRDSWSFVRKIGEIGGIFNKCLNGGSKSTGGLLDTCECPEPYYGRFCERYDCYNHGVCNKGALGNCFAFAELKTDGFSIFEAFETGSKTSTKTCYLSMFCNRDWAGNNLPLASPCLCPPRGFNGPFCDSTVPQKPPQRKKLLPCINGVKVHVPGAIKSYCQCFPRYYGQRCNLLRPLSGDDDKDESRRNVFYANSSSVMNSTMLTVGLPILVVILGTVTVFLLYICCLGKGRLRRQMNSRDNMTSRVHNFLANRDRNRRRRRPSANQRRAERDGSVAYLTPNANSINNAFMEGNVFRASCRAPSAPPPYDAIIEKPPSYVTAMKMTRKL